MGLQTIARGTCFVVFSFAALAVLVTATGSVRAQSLFEFEQPRFVFGPDGQVIDTHEQRRRQQPQPNLGGTVPTVNTAPPIPPMKPDSASGAPRTSQSATVRDRTQQPGIRGGRVGVVHFPAITSAPVETTRNAWSVTDIRAARRLCQHLVAEAQAVVTPAKPMRRGVCGDAAPVHLHAIGSGADRVTFEPAATVNCRMVKALSDWVRHDLAPLARKHVGKRIATVEVMSDYSCRRAYGRRNASWSQHAFANALDIRGFAFAGGSKARLLSHWGPTARKIRYLIAKEAKKREREAAAVAEAEAESARANRARAVANGPSEAPKQRSASSGVGLLPTLADGMASSVFGDIAKRGLGTAPNQLGGPKAKRASNGDIKRAVMRRLFRKVNGSKRAFLKAAHTTACARFTTVLGPELNRTHENHFHVDLSNTRKRSFCR